MKNLLSIDDLTKDQALEILDTAVELSRLSDSSVRKFPTLRGRPLDSCEFQGPQTAALAFLALFLFFRGARFSTRS